LPEEVQLHLLTEENIIAQIGNLKTYPSVATRLAAGKLQLHGWLYHIHSGEIVTYNIEKNLFVPLGKDANNATPARRIQYEPSSLEVVA
jgi:carbonic anhydrase